MQLLQASDFKLNNYNRHLAAGVVRKQSVIFGDSELTVDNLRDPVIAE